MKSTLERFEAKFIKSSGCWNWAAGVDKNGYGRFRVGLNKIRAPRMAYTLYRGDISDGLMVRHHCDNPACVNPFHLILGTNADNMADKVSRNRQATGAKVLGKRRSYKGEGGPRAKLSAQQVSAIKLDPRRHFEIAREYGVCRATISHAKRGLTWAS
jgi:HNH endonuclease